MSDKRILFTFKLSRLRKHLLVYRNNIKKAKLYKKYNKNNTYDLNIYSTNDESESTILDDSNSKDTSIIDDNEYNLETEKKAEILFRKLTRQQKLKANKLAAVGSHKITQFFSSTNNINLNDNEKIKDQLDYKSENDPIEESAQ
ncbi:13174_t:CDS:2 [Cetraspora pellucida]|uniref:13174_t:CDS:1 n=1 Tax=Cetraspora pellucida TaxID=1433469 RepID=A0A9N9EJX2_9GLOM|nr:13174_t:CDS:2 [Cetraspora pellucida]